MKESIHDFHFQIVEELFGKGAIPENVRGLFAELEGKLGILPSKDYDFEYDQLICYGELLSTSIIADYLDSIQKNVQWVDIRKCLKTNKQYREAIVDWAWSGKLIKETFDFTSHALYITQGFIGSTDEGFSTSLGRGRV